MFTFGNLPVGAKFKTTPSGDLVYTKIAAQVIGRHVALPTNINAYVEKEGAPATSTLPTPTFFTDSGTIVFPLVTCFDCVHADKYEGSSGKREEPPEEPSIECPLSNEEGTIEGKTIFHLLEAHGECCASACPRFNPVMVGKCWECESEIGQPVHTWKLWISTIYENYAVCSDHCKATGQARIEEEERKQKEAEEAYYQNWADQAEAQYRVYIDDLRSQLPDQE